jgi:hypothetical protein
MGPIRDRRFRLLLTLLAVAGLSCSSSTVDLQPVRGTVHYEGQPAEGATVILEPIRSSSTSKPAGTVSADGSFVIATHPHGNGAPAGEYAIIITWFPANARQAENPKNKLPAKYADPAQTPVPKVTVAAGGTTIPPIQITAK